MKIKKLIRLLKDFNQDADIWIANYDTCICSDIIDIEYVIDPVTKQEVRACVNIDIKKIEVKDVK